MSYPLLVDILVLLAIAIPLSFLFSKLKLPAIVGFLATGIIAGPFGARLISRIDSVRAMADIGVVLLLFTIGLEFSFRNIFSRKTGSWLLGPIQVAITILATALATHFLGLPIRQGIALGFLFSLSSTALVLKILSDRAELDTPHGRIAVGILVLQDLCVIPMMLLIPTIAGQSFEVLVVARQLLYSGIAIAVVIFATRYLVPLLLAQVLQLKNRDLFLLTTLFVCLGTAYLSSRLGLSLALGAFIAGLVISQSEYSHQILADILPFRDTFNALFFISIGMLLNISLFAGNWQIHLLVALAVFTGKALLILALLLAGRKTFRISWVAGLTLAQVGEFSFILARQFHRFNLLPEDIYQMFLSSAVLTMLATPFVFLFAQASGMKLQGLMGISQQEEGEALHGQKELSDHLVIIGYGLNGKNLARVVKDIGIPFVVVELNHNLVLEGQRDDIPLQFGDASRQEVLNRAGAASARMAVIAISDPAASRRCVAVVRSMNRKAVILVRTRDVAEVDSLTRLGADMVIPEEFETSIEIFARVLEQYRVPDHLVNQQISVIRSSSYGMLRGLSVNQERLLKLSELFLKSTVQQVVVTPGSPVIGRSLAELDLRRRTGVSVIAVISNEVATTNPGAEQMLNENDIVVLWGAHVQLAEASKLFELQTKSK